MAWWNRRSSSSGDEVTKNMPALPTGSSVTPAPNVPELLRQMQGLQGALAMAQQQASLAMRWSDSQGAFGPGIPTPASPLDPARDDGSGRPTPRQYEYPVAWNLPGSGRKLVPWQTLRGAGDLDIVRALIEAKKQELSGLEWDVTIGKRALGEAIAADPDTPRATLEKQMRERLAPEIARAVRFWEQPDPDNGLPWGDWLGVLLEEVLVLDALAIYPSHDGAGLRSLWILDGATIKPLLDHRGMRPAPPNPAFQQLLHGFPRGDFIADSPDGKTIPGGYPGDQLIYRRQVTRTWTPYGYSAVERALPIIAMLGARDGWIRSEYTDGAVPDVFMTPESGEDIQPENWQLWQRTINDALAGDPGARRRIQLGIPGSTLHQFEHDAERYKPDYDLYLLQRLAAHFDMPLTELGFINPKGLGSAGFHEGQDDVNQRRNVLPWCRWLSDLMSNIQTTFLDVDAALEFTFLGLDDEDEAATDAVADAQTRGGRATLNEGRDKLGLDRYDFPEADQPFIVAGREIIFIQGELERQANAQANAQAQADQLTDPSLAPTPGLVDPDAQTPVPAKKVAGAKPPAAKAAPAKAVPAKKAPAKVAPKKGSPA